MLATRQQIKDFGFDATQFRSPDDWDVADGYLDRVLASAADRVREYVGGKYDEADASGDADAKRLARQLADAEAHFAAAILWRRIETFNAAQVKVGRTGSGGTVTVGSRELNNATQYEDAGMAIIRDVMGWTEASAIATSVVQSTHFANEAEI